MTAIVGLVHDDRVLIGGDSAGVGGWTVTHRRDCKVFVTGPYVLGFTTSYRMGQILRWRWEPPKPKPTENLDRFMCTTWIDSVREALKDGGWAKKDSEQEKGGEFLVGIRGHLFSVDDDYQVGEQADGYDAVGSGATLSLGAFAATANLDMDAEKRALVALEAAERHNIGVRGPFHLVWEPQ